MHRSVLIALVLLCRAAAVAQGAAPPHDFLHVRVQHPEIITTLAQSREASPTLDALLAELEASNVIVHVVAAQRSDGAMLASLRWVIAAGGFRYLRISINRQLNPRLGAAMLAHELQHAIEVARAPDVVDAAAFAALYRQIGAEGRACNCGQCYDTVEARRTGQIVWEELRRVRFAF